MVDFKIPSKQNFKLKRSYRNTKEIFRIAYELVKDVEYEETQISLPFSDNVGITPFFINYKDS